MKSIRKAVAALAVTALAGGVLMIGAGSASAATVPPWEPDANSEGSLVFYNAAGTVVTSGTDLSHLFDYAVASTEAGRTGTSHATMQFAFPDHTKPDTSTWNQVQVSTSSVFPNAAAPAPVNGFDAHRPVVTLGATDANLTAVLGGATLDSTSGYANLIQVVVKDSGPGIGNGPLSTPFWETDISYNAAANTWTQVFPAPLTATTTTLVAAANPATVGDTVTLTATEAPATAGSVQFKDGAANIGTAVAVNGSGVAMTTTTTLAQGSHSLSAVFTPTNPSFSPSTGTTTEVINQAAPHTNTALAVSGGSTTAGADTTLTATVTDATTSAGLNAGSVAFFDNGSATALGTVATGTAAGVFALDLPTGFAAGTHSIVAKFTPTDPSAHAASQSAPQAFITQAALGAACSQTGSVCSDTQNIQATIPVGTLVINTPYTSAHPLDLGTLALNAGATEFFAQGQFSAITVTDGRSGNLPWTITALSSALVDGGANPGSTINSQNVGLTNLANHPGVGFAGTVTTTDNPAADPAVAPGAALGAAGHQGLGLVPHTVAAADHGVGTTVLNGLLTLTAPTSTEAGLFTGTITFTIS